MYHEDTKYTKVLSNALYVPDSMRLISLQSFGASGEIFLMNLE